ncbi:MAG: hypothetical protein MUO85_07900 [candidate division Zixibacteria bacterium]|nr:hypothetical protein [candidate division Zixibacteria bacterium]
MAKGKSNFSIDALISYLRLWGHLFDLYFNFDTNFSDQGFKDNYENQLKMEKEGLHPVPVIHNFFNFEIDFYLSLGKYPWLALGSAQSKNFADFQYAVNRIKRKDPNVKIHWFGGSRYDWLIQTQVASCDTSSWAKTGSFGHILYWNGHKEGLNKADRIYVGGYMHDDKDDETYHFVTYPWRKELEEYLSKTFGFEYGDLLGYEDKFNMQLINTRFYAELERRVNEERLKRGISLE